jgi:hypothetical protein
MQVRGGQQQKQQEIICIFNDIIEGHSVCMCGNALLACLHHKELADENIQGLGFRV